jgi:hypothetical protein
MRLLYHARLAYNNRFIAAACAMLDSYRGFGHFEVLG